MYRHLIQREVLGGQDCEFEIGYISYVSRHRFSLKNGDKSRLDCIEQKLARPTDSVRNQAGGWIWFSEVA